MPAEPDARRLLAALAEAEEAPLAAEVHLDRPGRRPVEGDEVVARAHRSKPNAAPARVANNLGNEMAAD